jgi:hypothetical protein
MTERCQCRLTSPTPELEESHTGFVHEFRSRDEQIVPWIAGEPYRTFGEYIVMLQRASKGLDLRPGFVAHSTYWLLDTAGEIVAISNLRHELTEDLLVAAGDNPGVFPNTVYYADGGQVAIITNAENFGGVIRTNANEQVRRMAWSAATRKSAKGSGRPAPTRASRC